jgi:uncharacterized protein (TIGR03435 family)
MGGFFVCCNLIQDRQGQGRDTGVLRFGQNGGRNKHERQQVPSLRCGMTSKKTGNGKRGQARARVGFVAARKPTSQKRDVGHPGDGWEPVGERVRRGRYEVFVNREIGSGLKVCGKALFHAVVGMMLAGVAVAQAPQGSGASGVGGKRMAFEVVSIRPSWRNFFGAAPQAETTAIRPDGYRTIDQPMISTIIFAYLPMSYSWTSESKPLNQPKWAGDEYDIDAKVAAADMAAWQRQGPQQEMWKAMLRSMLEDRCKLAVHWVPGQTSGYALVVGKHGSKMKKATPGEAIPPNGLHVRVGNVFYPDATFFPRSKGDPRTDYPFYNISMQAMAGWLSENFEAPVVNQTGLDGNYDLVLNKRQEMGGESGSDPGGEASKWDLEALGLKLVPMKVATRRLVIDHIERPSAN